MQFLYLFADIISTVLNLISLVIFVSAIVNLLIHLEIVNRFRHKFIFKLDDFLSRLTEPMYRFVRTRIIGPINGIDLSPLILILAIQFFEKLMYMTLAAIA